MNPRSKSSVLRMAVPLKVEVQLDQLTKVREERLLARVKVVLVERQPRLACDIVLTDVELSIRYPSH